MFSIQKVDSTLPLPLDSGIKVSGILGLRKPKDPVQPPESFNEPCLNPNTFFIFIIYFFFLILHTLGILKKNNILSLHYITYTRPTIMNITNKHQGLAKTAR